MRVLALGVPMALLLLAGCSFNDCGPFPAPFRFAGAEAVVPEAPMSDTLTVLFVSEGPEWMDAQQTVPRASAAGELRVEVAGDIYAGVPRVVPQFETAVRGDTLFMRLPPVLMRRVCSPAEGAHFRVTQVEAPAAVRWVRVRTVGAGEVSFPASLVPAPSAPASVTV